MSLEFCNTLTSAPSLITAAAEHAAAADDDDEDGVAGMELVDGSLITHQDICSSTERLTQTQRRHQTHNIVSCSTSFY